MYSSRPKPDSMRRCWVRHDCIIADTQPNDTSASLKAVNDYYMAHRKIDAVNIAITQGDPYFANYTNNVRPWSFKVDRERL